MVCLYVHWIVMGVVFWFLPLATQTYILKKLCPYTLYKKLSTWVGLYFGYKWQLKLAQIAQKLFKGLFRGHKKPKPITPSIVESSFTTVALMCFFILSLISRVVFFSVWVVL